MSIWQVTCNSSAILLRSMIFSSNPDSSYKSSNAFIFNFNNFQFTQFSYISPIDIPLIAIIPTIFSFLLSHYPLSFSHSFPRMSSRFRLTPSHPRTRYLATRCCLCDTLDKISRDTMSFIHLL